MKWLNYFKNKKENKKTMEINENTPLLTLAGPMFIETLLAILVNNIDTLMLSHYSENAVGAVGNANQLMSFFILMFGIIATATTVVVAQYLGAGRHDVMDKIYTLVIIVNLFFGLFLSGILVLFKRQFMGFLHVSPEMMPHAITYILIVGGMLFMQAVYNVLLQILRCNGYTRVGMYISFAINIINMVGNYLFLYGPLKFLNLGVAGVALSTVIARLVAVIAALVFFYRKKIGKLKLRLLSPFPFEMLWQMIKIGLPSAGESMSYNMYQMVLLSIINTMGNDSVNARVYCQSLISFAMVFSNTSAMATQIITGHLVGAKKEDAAYKRVFKTLFTSMPITIALALINWLISPFTLRFFTENENIIHLAFYIMLVDVFIEIGRCLNMTFICSLKAAGDYIFPLVVGIMTMWLLGATGGYFFGKIVGLGVAGVFMGTAIDECVRGFVVMGRFRSRKWIGKSVVKETD